MFVSLNILHNYEYLMGQEEGVRHIKPDVTGSFVMSKKVVGTDARSSGRGTSVLSCLPICPTTHLSMNLKQ